MKSKLILLATGMLAGGMLFATEANAQAELFSEQQEQTVSPDIDLTSLIFEVVEVEDLPKLVKEQLASFEEDGAVLIEAWIAKTKENAVISKLVLAEGEEDSLIYLDENGEVLKKEKLPVVEEIEEQTDESVE